MTTADGHVRTVPNTASLYTRTPPNIMGATPEDISDTPDRWEASDALHSDMSMMRIAVAGTGGLARIIAHYIDQDTSHHVVFLSRAVSLQANMGWLSPSISCP